jgi:glycosyltransferase involved in cell wall biosynthesis
MGIVKGVLAGNRHLAEHARSRNPAVTLLPTCVDPDAVPARTHGPSDRPVVGWIGTPGNLAHLAAAAPALAALAHEASFVLRIVSSEPWDHPGVPVESVPWSARSEAEEIARFDVGIMPLRPTPDAEGKCGLKLLQYAAAGVPAVATPIGVNREIVRPGETGFLAEDDAGWEGALRRLLADAGLRGRLGRNARTDARERWSYDAWEPELLRALGAGRSA